MKKTKIVATIGPASQTIKMLRLMIRSGMNVCRLNFSHGDYKWHSSAIRKIRKAAELEKKNIAIMADIQGPRIRVSSRTKVALSGGEKIFLSDDASLHSHRYKKELNFDWKNFYSYVKKGDRVYIEDGIIDLEIIARKKGGCVARVLEGGTVKPNKGVNIPSISHHMGFLTNKDLEDLNFILGQEVDYVAISFVSSKKDVFALREIMDRWKKKQGSQTKEKKIKGEKIKLSIPIKETINFTLPLVVSKIERRSAIKNLKDIINASDAIMVARGDLAIEMPQQKIGVLQKDIIKKCLQAKKPVIVATQMMNSMISLPRPTRAEISDVTNAVIDHADAVMLSGETANGKYPDKVVATMTEIIKETEKSSYDDLTLRMSSRFARIIFRARRNHRKTIAADSFKEAAQLASLRQEDMRIRVVCRSCPDKRQASLVWGVE